MTDFKRRTLLLSSGKQIKLYGNSIAICNSLEIGEGAAPNIFSFMEQQTDEKHLPESTKTTGDNPATKEKLMNKTSAVVSNPHRLTKEEVVEIADYNIRLWMDLKDNIRKHGISNPKIFNREQ
jgi:hypothetical protein